MKKTFFAIMLMLASVVALNAQNLTGHPWLMSPSFDDGAMLVLNFDDNGNCVMAVSGEESEDESGMKITFNIAIALPGSYAVNGNKMRLDFDPDNVDVNIDYDVEGVDAQTKKMLDSMLKPEIEKLKPVMTKEMLKEIPNLISGELTISLSSGKLVLISNDGNEVSFVPAPTD